MSDSVVAGLDQWTRSYLHAEVEISYDRSQDVLIKPPTRVIVLCPDGSEVTCFFKSFVLSFGPAHARKELLAHEKITKAKLPPEALVCQLYGIVRDGNDFYGMLFTWIDKRTVLSEALAAKSSALLKERWAGQISRSIEHLHQRGIIWGDAKAQNVLVDRSDDVWIIDFGGSYTPGWVDKEKAETLEGDAQGLAKILDMLG